MIDSCGSLYFFENNERVKKNIKRILKKHYERGNNGQARVKLGNILEYGDAKIDQDSFNLRERGC